MHNELFVRDDCDLENHFSVSFIVLIVNFAISLKAEYFVWAYLLAFPKIINRITH